MGDFKTYQRNAASAGVLMDAGIVLMRQNLRRRNPSATESEVDALLQDWLCRKNDPLPGDTAGCVRIRETAQPSDLGAAMEAVRLIESRGFNRSRDLTDALTKAWQESRQ